MSSLTRHHAWQQLCDADEARKAAHRNAEKSATLYLVLWLESCAEWAWSATTPEAFDLMMRSNHTYELQSGEVSTCCQQFDETSTELLERIRGMLSNIDFPFAVQVYQSKENHGNFILTIPNQGGLAED
ncbi:MAG: hypothetical protein ACM3KF_04415 [Acidobacteriota bacterium]